MQLKLPLFIFQDNFFFLCRTKDPYTDSMFDLIKANFVRKIIYTILQLLVK